MNSLGFCTLQILVSLLTSRTLPTVQRRPHCSAYTNATTMKSFNVLLGFIATIGVMTTGVLAMPVSVARR